MQGTGRRALRLFLSLCHAPDCAPSPVPDCVPGSAPDRVPGSAPDRMAAACSRTTVIARTIAAPPLAPLPCRPHHRRSPRAVRISVRTYSPRRRPHLRPPPVTSLPHSRPRRPPCLPLPGGFFPNFRCVFRTRHATNVCTFIQHTENKYVTIKAEKDNLLTESKLHFSGFPAGRHGATDP